MEEEGVEDLNSSVSVEMFEVLNVHSYNVHSCLYLRDIHRVCLFFSLVS